MYEFRLKFHWSLFLRIHSTIFQHWFRQWLGADQATSHCLNQLLLIYWRIYASLGLNDWIDQHQNIKSHKRCAHFMGCTLFTTYFVFPEVCLSLRPGDPLSCSTRHTSWTNSSSCFWAEIQPNSCCLHFGDFTFFLSPDVPDFLEKKRLIRWASPAFLLTHTRAWKQIFSRCVTVNMFQNSTFKHIP